MLRKKPQRYPRKITLGGPCQTNIMKSLSCLSSLLQDAPSFSSSTSSSSLIRGPILHMSGRRQNAQCSANCEI